MTHEQEKKLTARARKGDSSAFEELMLSCQTQVYNLALRMTGSEQDALDMSQEAFIKAWNSLESFRGDSRFSVWMYRLTTNVCLDFLRASKRRSHDSLTLPETDEGQDESRELEIPDERFSPESLAERSELREVLKRGLEALPEEFRSILLLREIGGLSYDEIGKSLALGEGTVKSRIFRARKKLCEILLADGNFSYTPASKDRREG